MSWSNITGKNVSIETKQEIIKKKNIVHGLSHSNEIIETHNILKINQEEDLFNDLGCIKENTVKFTPWLLSKASTYNILDFLYNYIEEDKIIIESDNDSDDYMID